MRVWCVLVCVMMLRGDVGRAQSDQGEQQRLLPQWLTGVLAVVGFLFLSFVGFLINKAWCQNARLVPSDDPEMEGRKEGEFSSSNGSQYNTILDTVRSTEHDNAYENLAVDAVDRVTAM